ncbi:MAG: hypothetical protein ABIJ26_06685 [Candidatus Margulisiibacteriota bacterium]
MEISVFIAKFFALLFVAIGLGMLIDRVYYHKMTKTIVKAPATIYLGGLLALLIGFILVESHNVWIKDWSVIITVLGWLALVKGVLLLLLPRPMMSLASRLVKGKNAPLVYGIILLVLGLVVGYFGFIA